MRIKRQRLFGNKLRRRSTGSEAGDENSAAQGETILLVLSLGRSNQSQIDVYIFPPIG